mgnify:CR=1 FL=1
MTIMNLKGGSINYELIKNDKDTKLFIVKAPNNFDYKKLIINIKCDNADIYKNNKDRGYYIAIKN